MNQCRQNVLDAVLLLMTERNKNHPSDPNSRGKRELDQPARETLENSDDFEIGIAPPADIPPAPQPFRKIEEEEPQEQSYAPHELERRQLSLGGLMVIVTAISALLAPISFLPIKVYTAILGGLVLLLFIISALMGAKELIVRVTLWSLLAIYLITLFIACKDQIGF